MGTDIFSLKFLNESCNFFFTTRSNDWRIMMRETELYPLCFIYPGHELKIMELLTGQSFSIPGTVGNFYALNLEAVRLKFFTDYGVLANLLTCIAVIRLLSESGSSKARRSASVTGSGS
ncbi:hypothetical protein NXW89_31495 [Bacteroides thetaiotaomicron]|nr:hypothetical protein [Bacteroides thetaiotaomicron]